ncbi:LPXTG cell wall anchor domain-containing protein [Streptomyces piniterrae]|uniref:LPXTG cell wall anchor domain-containing protein n=1 Tax=Streptomyces piniterrae TaxID=2571125 RepID=A0A4U0NRZ4_9ACTN|nr:DUF6801 domain-containing protein [Streptomyces piniterrae]TJZ57369.1 LPXTG cell wall anchor domain-containing protein [Streptomyces piniterrae]
MRTALGVATALGTAVGVVGVTGAGTAAAQQVSRTLRYTCDVPMLGDQPFTAKIDADIPESVEVGEPSRKFAIEAGTTVDAELTPLLDRIGVKSVEGTVNAKIGVTAPQGNRHLTVPLDIARTPVPASGSFTVTGTGSAPALTFRQPGHGRITVGDIGVHVVGRKADGDVRGKVDVRCTLDDGQNDVVGSFEITGAGTGTTTGSTTSGTSGTSGSDSEGTDSNGTHAKDPTSDGGTIANTGEDTSDLILPAAGILVAGVVAFFLGSRLKKRGRAGDDG